MVNYICIQLVFFGLASLSSSHSYGMMKLESELIYITGCCIDKFPINQKLGIFYFNRWLNWSLRHSFAQVGGSPA